MGKTPRKSFAKQEQILELPNMLKIQKDSYEWFLREGLREVFRDVDTITDYTGNLELSFLDYSMNEPQKPRRLLRRRGRQDRPAHLFRDGHPVPRRMAGIRDGFQ